MHRPSLGLPYEVVGVRVTKPRRKSMEWGMKRSTRSLRGASPHSTFTSSTGSPFSPACLPLHCSTYPHLISLSSTPPLASSSHHPLSYLSHPPYSDGMPSTLPP